MDGLTTTRITTLATVHAGCAGSGKPLVGIAIDDPTKFFAGGNIPGLRLVAWVTLDMAREVYADLGKAIAEVEARKVAPRNKSV